MKKIMLLFVLCVFVGEIFAQKEIYDLVTYTPPKGWKKDVKTSYLVYSDSKQNSYCMIAIYKSTDGSNNITTDFTSEWKQLAATPYKITTAPSLQEIEKENGWATQTGGATFSNNGGNNILLLATSSGYGKVISIMILTNDTSYMSSIEKFSNSIQLNKPAVSQTNNTTVTTGNNSKADVWQNLQSNALSGGTGYWSFIDPTSVKFYVVYADGDYCAEMPLIGLQTFDKAKSKSSGERSWGKFVM